MLCQCCVCVRVCMCVTDEHRLVYKESGWWQWQDLMSRSSPLLMPWPYGRVLLYLPLTATDGARSNTAQQNLSHCFTGSNHNRRRKGERQEEIITPAARKKKSVHLQSWCPEGQIPERKHPEWLLVIDWYGNECLIIPSARARRAAYTVTAPWPAFWQTVTSSCHITQGLIKRDPKIDKQ